MRESQTPGYSLDKPVHSEPTGWESWGEGRNDTSLKNSVNELIQGGAAGGRNAIRNINTLVLYQIGTPAIFAFCLG